MSQFYSMMGLRVSGGGGQELRLCDMCDELSKLQIQISNIAPNLNFIVVFNFLRKMNYNNKCYISFLIP